MNTSKLFKRVEQEYIGDMSAKIYSEYLRALKVFDSKSIEQKIDFLNYFSECRKADVLFILKGDRVICDLREDETYCSVKELHIDVAVQYMRRVFIAQIYANGYDSSMWLEDFIYHIDNY